MTQQQMFPREEGAIREEIVATVQTIAKIETEKQAQVEFFNDQLKPAKKTLQSLLIELHEVEEVK